MPTFNEAHDTAITPALSVGEQVERVLIAGDLSKLTADQRLLYYNKVCQSLGLNPLTRPLEYIILSNKLTLYARKDATEQLRKLHGVSITDVTGASIGDVYVVTAKAQDAAGRTDVATGAVSLTGLRGEALANGFMKAETKAKRRVTLSLCGLGMLDESEVDTLEAKELPELPEAPAQPSSPRAEMAAEVPKLVTDAQRRKLFATAKEHGWQQPELKTLLATHGFTSSAQITQAKYDTLLFELEGGIDETEPAP